MPLAPGTLLNNRYRIISILGQGGMGAVYRASDEHLHIPVAVKENLFLTEEYGRQFQREAHILAGLRHYNLPHVTDYFSMENQVQYLVMDYVEGEDLRQRMERMGALPERETILVGISICDALTYLHTRHPPIVHRDIKPGNIKVTPDGHAVLVDFGLAKIMQGAQMTSTGARAMTPGYSPPEQYGTARTDPRSDIYSLGATLYAAITGVIPEDGLGRMTGKSKLTPVRDLVPKANRRLAETIEGALEIEPEDRHQSAEELKHDLIESGELTSYYPERPVITPPPSEPREPSELDDEEKDVVPSRPYERGSKRRRKNRWKWAVAPAAAVVLVLALMLFLRPDITHNVLAYLQNGSSRSPGSTEVAGLFSPTAAHEDTPTGETQPTTPQPIAAGASSPTPEPSATSMPTVTQTLAPTATPRGGGPGQIAFASDRVGVMQVWLMDVATKKAHQITKPKDGACQPAWSPDGTRLAFISPCPGMRDAYQGSNIYTINIDAAGNAIQESVTQITSSLEGDYDPAWAPDGKRIAFTSLRTGKTAIWIIYLDDLLNPQKVSMLDYADRQPAWSPLGFQLAFVRKRLNNEIWVMSDNGDQNNRFSPVGPVNNSAPNWSSDGTIIFYSQTTDASAPVLVYRRYPEDRDNNIENHIPNSLKGDSGPIASVSPSPDGFWLAYESWPDGKNRDIYLMNTNGANQERLTNDAGFDFGPAWRPMAAAAVQ